MLTYVSQEKLIYNFHSFEKYLRIYNDKNKMDVVIEELQNGGRCYFVTSF